MKRIIFKKAEREPLQHLSKEVKNCWIDLENPSDAEIEEIARKYRIEKETLVDALDENEVPRITKEKRYTFIILRVVNREGNKAGTTPLGIILLDNYIITVHKQTLEILNKFFEDRIRFSTAKRVRLLLKIIREIIVEFTKNLRCCEKKIRELEKKFLRHARNEDIVYLASIKEDILDMQNAILENNKVFDAILAGHYLKLSKSEEESMYDLLIDSKQCITMASFFVKVAANTQNTFEWIISNNFNILMKRLTSIAAILSLPVIISGFYGMNVALPLQQNTNAFWILLSISLALSLMATAVFKAKGWI